MAQAAALAALEDDEHVQSTRKNNAEGLRFFENAFSDMGIETVPSHANFILAKVCDGKTMFDQLQKIGIITRAMGGYGLPDWIRISIGTPLENGRCLAALADLR
jgi:histidinol-phosphate aminotransferase